MQQEFVFSHVAQAPLPSLLQNFSAPVKLNYDYSANDFAFLMSHDRDPFNRWEAGQQFATKWLLTAIEAMHNKQVLPANDQYIEALRVILQDSELDAAFIAETLIVPSESYLAEYLQPVDVDVIYQARTRLQTDIATHLEELLLNTYQNNSVRGNYHYNAQDMGKRRLAGICLMYLNMLTKEQYTQLAREQFENGGNMTDTMTALEAVNDLEIAFRDQAMQAFAEQWQHDTLVMDKWFSLHARSRRPNVLEKVQDLLQHPCFSIKNPNKVRALIGVFAMANPTAFHAENGAGYEFLTQQVLALDTINPQVAARLVKPLIDWQKYNPQRQQLMQNCLQKIIDTNGLSRDVHEIVDRSLKNVTH